MLSKVVYRSTLFATIIAVALASLSVTGVFAAGLKQSTSSQRITDRNLSSQWKQELIILQLENIRNIDIAKWFRGWMETAPSSADRAKENKFAVSADSALLQAEAIAAKHAGFDTKGMVTDREQAAKTVENLKTYLHDFHVDLLSKLENLFF